MANGAGAVHAEPAVAHEGDAEGPSGHWEEIDVNCGVRVVEDVVAQNG